MRSAWWGGTVAVGLERREYLNGLVGFRALFLFTASLVSLLFKFQVEVVWETVVATTNGYLRLDTRVWFGRGAGLMSSKSQFERGGSL